MKQEINLYQVDKKKWIIDLTFEYLIWGLLGFLGILLIVTLSATFNHFSVKGQLTQLEKEQEGKSKALQTIAGQVPAERTREQLMNDIKKYQDQKQAKQEILNSLAETIGADKGFTGFLDALATKTRLGLWFTKLSFRENGNFISLQGHSLKPEYVPTLITGLSNDPAFSGKKFILFKEALDDKTQQIDFVLETKSAEKP